MQDRLYKVNAMIHPASTPSNVHLQWSTRPPLPHHPAPCSHFTRTCSLHWALPPAMPCTYSPYHLITLILYQVPGALRSWHVDDMGYGMLSMFLTHACKFSVMYAQHYGQETRRWWVSWDPGVQVSRCMAEEGCRMEAPALPSTRSVTRMCLQKSVYKTP